MQAIGDCRTRKEEEPPRLKSTYFHPRTHTRELSLLPSLPDFRPETFAKTLRDIRYARGCQIRPTLAEDLPLRTPPSKSCARTPLASQPPHALTAWTRLVRAFAITLVSISGVQPNRVYHDKNMPFCQSRRR